MSLGRVTTPSDMKGPVLVRVVSSEYAGDNQWDYQVELANWTEQKSIAASQCPARNIWERENTATTAMGLPAGVTADLKPCPDDTFVFAFYSPVEAGYLFQWPNQWECAE
ncbi:hypothetical protein [Herbaspirillum sp.]|uniref:hypothetical protein n=1 Tax=Herbaspirillum sp. TaxID=1890675 RepID=UPI00257D9313|nr:hypothetical protein [Herbaspirillum sp.]|tara:strand:+ start:2199 stop:2528 length:330 start_codon:yes stop_codon:yes gene_type:complete